MLESIWDFEQSAFIMLGEAGVSKSPLERSVLMAQARWNKVHYQIEAEPCIRCTPEIDFLRGEQGSKVMGDFLDNTSLNNLSIEDGQGFPRCGSSPSLKPAALPSSRTHMDAAFKRACFLVNAKTHVY